MQHRGDHDIAHYERQPGETLGPTSVGTGSVTQLNSDAQGPLPPGRYLIQVANLSTTGIVLWLHFGRFEKSAPLAPSSPTSSGRNRIALSLDDRLGIELHLLGGEHDRVAAQAVGGTCDVILSRISTTVPKGNQ